MPVRQKSVEKLISLVQSRQDLKDALETSLEKAQEPGINSLETFYNFLDKILTHIPTEKELMPSVRQFYFFISMSPNDILKKDKDFNEWINNFVISRGNFLDTIECTGTLEAFISNLEYKINTYIKGPSGWLSYNQFLARQLKPGKRPIEGRCDDSIIVSPADSEYKGQWTIAHDSTITVKGATYSVKHLLGESAYENKLKIEYLRIAF